MLHTISHITFQKLYHHINSFLSIICLVSLSTYVCLAQNSLVCNQSIQVSLTENCDAVITPAQIVKNFDSYVDYSIEVTSADGQLILDNTVTVDHIGSELSVMITNKLTDISCWSKVLIESKVFPEFMGCGDVTISCHSYPDTLYHMPQPEMGEGQCGTYTITYEDRTVEQQCSEDGNSHIVYRTWILENQSNYVYTCEQRIFVKRQTLADLYFPPHFNNEDYKAISCDYELSADGYVNYPHIIQLSEDLSPSTIPYPQGTGSPGGAYCSNIKVNYHDTHYPSCGNQIKILRRWNIIDWCTGEDKVQDQVIEIVDDRGPLLIYNGHYETINADFNDCYAHIKSVPFPIEIHDCSKTHYKVAYSYINDNGRRTDDVYDGVTKNGDGSYSISEIPVDSISLVYIVSDDCGHTSRKEVNFKLKDTKPPVAVCQTRSVVTLVEGGYVVLAADKLQHHSTDNCGIVKQLIKRTSSSCASYEDDLKFGPEITFCCADSGDENHAVTLRLFDKHGNYADCQTEIVVQDKIKPVILNCTPHKSINCLDDYSDIAAMGGEPETYDNCHMTMTFEDDHSKLNSCGFGKMYRTWKATDDHGNWSDCVQEINIVNEFSITDQDIVWPRPKTLTECVDSDYSPSRLGEPHIPYQNCSNFTFNYEDQVFYDGAEECMKILRHWSVIDWCKYDPGAEFSEGYWTQTQSIRLSDSTKPVFESPCEEIIVETSGTDCEILVDIEVNATDDCTLHNLNYSHTIQYANGEEENAEGSIASILFPPGQHAVLFQVSDGCGNVDECNIPVTVKDNNELHLICLQSLSISLGATGETDIWASDFIKEANAPCGKESEYNYSFTDDMTALSLTITCDDFMDADGTSLTKQLLIYGVDENRYSGSCTVDLTITDNFNLCENEEGSSAVISGKVYLENLTPLAHKMVFLEDMNKSEMQEQLTTETGAYYFNDIDRSHEYSLNLDQTGEALNGISTLDLIAIQNHILSTDLLDSPYQIIAADVDNSSSVTVADLIYLRKLILALETELPNKEVWKYLDAAHEFMDDTQPWGYIEHHYFSELSTENLTTDFIAVKIGDVNSSNSHAERRNDQFTTIDVSVDKVDGSGINYHLRSEANKSIYGCQVSLKYDAQDLTLHSIVDNHGVEITRSHYIDNDGKITISWNDTKPIIYDQEFLTIRFKYKENEFRHLDIAALELNHHFQNELYTTEMTAIRIENINEDDNDRFTIENAFPNPFLTESTISFKTAAPTQINLSVYTASGIELIKRKFWSKGGYENLALDFKNIQQHGILYCKIESENRKEIIKLIRLDN